MTISVFGIPITPPTVRTRKRAAAVARQLGWKTVAGPKDAISFGGPSCRGRVAGTLVARSLGRWRPRTLELRLALVDAPPAAHGARERGVRTGAPAFDAAVSIAGWPPHVLAVFDADTRADVLRLLDTGVVFGAESFAWTEPADATAARVRERADLLARLAVPEDIVHALTRIGGADPVDAVRRACRLALLTSFGHDPRVRRIAHAVTPEDPELYAAAAMVLRDVDAVIAAARDAGLDPEMRASCVRGLPRLIERKEADHWLRLLLGEREPKVVVAALETLAQAPFVEHPLDEMGEHLVLTKLSRAELVPAALALLARRGTHRAARALRSLVAEPGGPLGAHQAMARETLAALRRGQSQASSSSAPTSTGGLDIAVLSSSVSHSPSVPSIPSSIA